MLFPHIPVGIIEKVNRSIDNPDKKMVALQTSGIIDPKMLDLFGLTGHGHRRYNHSVPSAFMAAYMVNPEHAADIAMSHLIADKMSNYLHDSVGPDEKDIYEGMINKCYSMFKETNGIPSRKSKRMFY
jgi:hypothetical protein